MKRRLFKLGLLVLVGAIINVAVAWGCVHSYRSSGNPRGVPHPANESDRVFLQRHHEKPAEWLPNCVDERTSFGMTVKQIELFDSAWEKSWQEIHKQNSVISRMYTSPLCAVAISSAGLPCRSLQSQFWIHSDDWAVEHNSNQRMGDQRVIVGTWRIYGKDVGLPLIPIWPGFAINTIFYAAIVWLLFAFPFALRRRRRIKRGLCPACAYDLRGSPATTCPECGKAVKT